MRALAAALVAVLALPSLALAQNSRAEILEKERAAKATQLKPYEPSRLEKLVSNAQDVRRRIAPHNGFFFEYDYPHKPVGSGVGFGGGFRRDLLDRQARVELEVGASFRNYWMAHADFSLPRLLDEHLELGAEVVYRYHPQEDFYGMGPDSLEENRVSFLFEGTEVQGRAVVMPRRWLRAGSRVGHQGALIGSGKDSKYPSIEEVFTDQAAPGLAQQPDYVYADLFAEVDYRDEPGNARQGGYYALTMRRYSDRSFDRYSFNALDLLLQHFVPIFDKKRVFAFQFGLIDTSAEEGQEIPFYLRPTVGGSRTLRSGKDYRFRDTHALWMNVEYRWEAFGLLDMALFTDWGKVAPDHADFDFSGLKHAYGIGFRFNTSKTVFFRFDIATGAGEGVRYFVKYSRAF